MNTRLALAITFIIYALALLLICKPLWLPTARASELTAQDIVLMVNNDRTALGLKPLILDESLSQAAQAKANDEALYGYFSHISPTGITAPDYIKQRYWGENLGINFDNAFALEYSWMNSPTHRANILESRFAKTGIGISEGFYQGHKVNFIVQFFVL
jgi:uncharacterized protein YkwD